MFAKITSKDNEQYLEALKTRLNKLNTAIYEIAVPYVGSGSNAGYAKMVDGWNTLYSQATSWVLMIEDALQTEKKEENKKTDESPLPTLSIDQGTIDNSMQIRYLHDVLVKFIFSDGFAVIAKCFRDQDVAERAAIVIQSMIPPQSQVPRGFEDGLTTGSGGN